MGVQIRIPGTAVPVGERHPDQALHIDLPDPVRPGPGEQGPVLDEPQRVRDRRVMGPFDRRREVWVGQGPQGRDRLHGGEGEVEPGDRGRLLA